MPPQQAQPSGMEGVEPAPDDQGSGYSIEIAVSEQGIAVGVEGQEPQMAKSAEEAAQMVLKIIQSNGQAGGGNTEMQDAFAQGAM